MLKTFIRRVISEGFKIPWSNRLLKAMSWEIEQLRPDAFYSPVPSLVDLQASEQRTSRAISKELPGIDLHDGEQLLLLEKLSKYYHEQPWSDTEKSDTRFYFENYMYSCADAVYLYCMLRYLRPASIIEVGAGFTSWAMLDVAEKFLDGRLHLTCIEPNRNTVLAMLQDGQPKLNAADVLIKRVQEVEPDVFSQLCANDVLFIDSSHVLKAGSDVNYLLLEVLPRLKEGVYVHFHDVSYPFEYPQGFVRNKRAWNEAYALQAFLAFNETFEIVLFASYLKQFHEQLLADNMPLCLQNGGGCSLWLRKVK